DFYVRCYNQFELTPFYYRLLDDENSLLFYFFHFVELPTKKYTHRLVPILTHSVQRMEKIAEFLLYLKKYLFQQSFLVVLKGNPLNHLLVSSFNKNNSHELS